MIRLLVSALFFCTSFALQAETSAAWRVGRVSFADADLTAGTQVLITSAEINGDRLILRVGIQGLLGRPGPITHPPLSDADVALKITADGTQLARVSLDRTWKSGETSQLAMGQILAVTLVFQARPGLADTPMFLSVGGYAPISFRCADGTPLPVPDLTKTPERWELGEVVDAIMPGLENVRMELGTMRMWEGGLTFAVSFRNAGRFPFNLSHSPSGSDAVLVSAEREIFRKPVVTGAIEKNIAPTGSWRPDETMTGTVTFPLPHPHGLARLWFAYPGFPDVPLVFDQSLRRWRVEKESIVRRGVAPVQQRARAEEQLFQAVSAFWESFSRQLNRKEYEACAAHFDQPDECALLRGIEKVPLAFIEVRPAEAQRLAMRDDELVGVRMEVRFRYRGQPEEHAFLLVGGCRMKRADSPAGWRVGSLTLDLAPPWAQGYTAFGESEHFLLFYRPEGGQVEQAVSTLEQLEASWETISQTGLKLAARYAAFFCLVPEDHPLLTGDRSVNRAQASVASVALDENDQFRIYNTAVYVSPEIFAGPSPLQKRRRLQTALDHEMVHAALAPWSRAWMPGWLIEGAAVHLSGERRGDHAQLASALSSGLTLRALTETGALRDPTGDPIRLDMQYQLSSEAVAFIATDWGVKKLMDLYHAYSLEYPEAWHGPYGVDYSDENGEQKRRARYSLTQKLLKRVLGSSVEEIESAVRQRTQR